MGARAFFNPQKIGATLHSNALLILTLLGVVIGICLGTALWESRLDNKMVIGFPGEILLNLFKMIVLPLITVTLMCGWTFVILGVGKMDRKQLGYIGGFALLFFVITTLISVVIGIFAVWLIHPGDPRSGLGSLSTQKNQTRIISDARPETIDTFLDILRNAFTDNLFDSTIRYGKTEVVERTVIDSQTNQTTSIRKRIIKKDFGSNILGLVVFSMWFGAVLSFMGADAKPLVDILNVVDRVICKIVMLITWYSPFAIIFLLAQKIVEIKDPGVVLASLGIYLAVSLVCQLIIFAIQNIIYAGFACGNPFKLVCSQLKAIAMALGTSSSIATLPINMECIENNMGVHKAISQVVLPIAATINMNGTAIHIAISSIFIAQLNGSVLDFSDYAVVWITATLAAIGTAGVPSGSVFTMAVVLAAIRQPIDDVSIILPVDWIINRFRVVTNTYGDAVIACILDRYFGTKMRENDENKINDEKLSSTISSDDSVR